MYKDILLAVDLADRESQLRTVEAAATLARTFSATLHIVTVVPDFGVGMVGGFFPRDFETKALEQTDEALAGFAAEFVPSGIAVQRIVGHGSIYREIMHYADRASCDLIVMASHRPELQDYLLGPNAARVVRHANQSVLVVRD